MRLHVDRRLEEAEARQVVEVALERRQIGPRVWIVKAVILGEQPGRKILVRLLGEVAENS